MLNKKMILKFSLTSDQGLIIFHLPPFPELVYSIPIMVLLNLFQCSSYVEVEKASAKLDEPEVS